ncbi:MAG: hypothetical protein ABW123_21155 [Cystobacter sp.]
MPRRISSPPIAPPTSRPAASTPATKPASGLQNGAMVFPIDQASVKSGAAVTAMTTAPLPLVDGAKLETRFETEGPKVEKVVLGGTLTARTGTVKVATVNHHAKGGVHQQGAQIDIEGPSASYTASFNHQGRLGETSGNVAALATSGAYGQVNYTLDTQNHLYSATASTRANVSAGVQAEVQHEFKGVDADLYAKGTAKGAASAVLEGQVVIDPKNRTYVASGRIGAAATAEAIATFGGHLGRLQAKVELGAVAGAAFTAGAEASYRRGKLRLASEVKTATGVGSRIKSEVTLDTSSHRRPIKSGLVNAGLMGMTLGLPTAGLGPVSEPSHSRLKNLLKSVHPSKNVAPPPA